MRHIKKLMFDVLRDMEIQPTKRAQPSNNALKEAKALINFCLNEMSEITGRAIGRWRSSTRVDMKEYEKIAYMLAHKYSRCFDAHEQEEMFDELKAAGFEGIIQGLTNFNPTKNTKLSTFIYSRAKFAIQKAFAAIRKVKSRGVVSLNKTIDEGEDETEFGDVVGVGQDNSVEDIVERKIQHEALLHALEELDPKEKHIILLCSENNPHQVAKKTRIPIAQINDILKRVKDTIVKTKTY